MMSSAALPVIAILSMIYSETSPSVIHTRKYSDVTVNLDATSDVAEAAEKTIQELNENENVLKEKRLRSTDHYQNEDKSSLKENVKVEITTEESSHFDGKKENIKLITFHQNGNSPLNQNAWIAEHASLLKGILKKNRLKIDKLRKNETHYYSRENSQVKKDKTRELSLHFDVSTANQPKWIDKYDQNRTKSPTKEIAQIEDVENLNKKIKTGVFKTKEIIFKNEQSTNSEKWTLRVKRDDDDEDLVIWDNCPGKLQYEVIDGELKCVVRNGSVGLSNRLLGPLANCATGMRRAILPDGTRICLKKRSRRS